MMRALILAMMLMVPYGAAAQQSGDATARIEAALRQAREAGIPEALLQNRVAEGRAKGVPLERIADAVERRAASLFSAQELMRQSVGQTGQPELAAAADAVEAGVAGSAVAEIARSSRGDDRAVALAVLTYLHGQGIPDDQAVAQVRGALRQGPDALRNLPAQAAARGRGQTGRPADAGPPAGVSRGNAGRRGPPAGIPGPGSQPGAGRPDNPGRGQGGPPAGQGRQ